MKSINVAFVIILSIFLILILETISLLIGFKINNYCFIIYLAIIIFTIKKCKISIYETIFFLLILISSYYISNFFFDLSSDGQWYHQNMIIELKDGWNPIYEKYSSLDSSSIYVKHYSKGHEIISAAIYNLTGNIEIGKMINIMVAISCFIISLQFLKNYVSSFKSYLYALIISFNPIVITQMFTYYIDGFTYNIFVLLIISIIEYIKISNNKNAVIFIASISIFFSLKFTSLPIIGIVALITFAYFFYRKRKLEPQHIRLFLCSIISLLILCIIPYVTNILENKSVFYPVFEKNRNVLSGHIPNEINEKNNISKLFISIFSKTGIPEKDIASGLKLPFTFSLNEIKKLGNSTIVLGGFGVFFSGIFINSLLLFLAVLFYKLKQKNKLEISLIIIGLVFYISIFPEPWLARILPQVYLLPILLLLFYEFCLKKKYWLSLLKNITVTLFLINISLFIVVSLFLNTFYSLKTHYILSELKKINIVYNVQYVTFKSNLKRLEDKNIKYKLYNLSNEKEENLVFFEPKNLKYSTRIKAKLIGQKPTILIELENIYSKITHNKEKNQ